MTLICSACGHANPDVGKFCPECGSALAAPVGARKERKFATALFADLAGSTTLAEEEDPEVVQTAIGSVFDRLAMVIAGYDGLLENTWVTRSSRCSECPPSTRTTPSARSAPDSTCKPFCPVGGTRARSSVAFGGRTALSPRRKGAGLGPVAGSTREENRTQEPSARRCHGDERSACGRQSREAWWQRHQGTGLLAGLGSAGTLA